MRNRNIAEYQKPCLVYPVRAKPWGRGGREAGGGRWGREVWGGGVLL